MRALVYYNGDKYLNIEADEMVTDCGFLKVYKDGNMIAMFGEEIVDCAILNEKKEDKYNV